MSKTAAPPAAKKTAVKETAKSPQHGKVKAFYATIMLVMGGISMPAFLFCLLGSLPSVAAWIWDMRPSKSAAYTVIILNLAGLIPVLVEVVPMGWNLLAAMPMLQDMDNWLKIYGAAAIGWGILFVLPVIIRSYLLRQFEAEIEGNMKKQEDLVRAWGRRIVNDDNPEVLEAEKK